MSGYPSRRTVKWYAVLASRASPIESHADSIDPLLSSRWRTLQGETTWVGNSHHRLARYQRSK